MYIYMRSNLELKANLCCCQHTQAASRRTTSLTLRKDLLTSRASATSLASEPTSSSRPNADQSSFQKVDPWNFLPKDPTSERVHRHRAPGARLPKSWETSIVKSKCSVHIRIRGCNTWPHTYKCTRSNNCVP